MYVTALMECEHQYLKPAIVEFLEREKMARQQEQQESEFGRAREHIYSYPDGAVYMGNMCENPNYSGNDNRCLSHLRHGRGTLRTPAFVYGMPLKNYTSDEAVENADHAKWHEYAGTWENDNLHGYGVHLQKSGNGGEIVIFEGLWEHGKPKKSVHRLSSPGTSESSSTSDGGDEYM